LNVDGVRRVAIDVDPRELQERIVLAYTNASRNSGINNWEMTKRHIDGDAEVQSRFGRIRDVAAAMRAALERRDWKAVGEHAAETIAHLGAQIGSLPAEDRLKIPGIGKDLASKVSELLETGSTRYHQELLQEFPPTVLDLLRLQGVGPKTVALLYHGLGVRSL